MIVNDEIMTLMILGQILERSIGIPSQNITKAENGKIAVNAAMSNNFDLILMDLNMPVMCGFDAVKAIK